MRISGFSPFKIPLWIMAGLAFCLASACASDPKSHDGLQAGEQALQNHQYDQAMREADAVLATGRKDSLAEANYLRGKALEERPKPDAAAASRDLAAARDCYAQALTQHPGKRLESLLHGQLGNAAFYLDDYPTALREWTIAYAQIDAPSLKESILYGIGVCQQRLGRFTDADQTFEKVQETYPQTETAQRARAHIGVQGFYVQVGAFSKPGDADRAASAIRSIGSVPLKTTKNNLTIIRTPDVPSYIQAAILRSRLADRYPDARVMP